MGTKWGKSSTFKGIEQHSNGYFATFIKYISWGPRENNTQKNEVNMTYMAYETLQIPFKRH